MSKPIQSAPTFNRGLQAPMPAQLYYVQAKQAYADRQWQQTCTLVQACIAAKADEKLRFLAQSLLAEALVKMNQFEPALVVLVELHQLKPNDAGILSNIGLTLMYLSRHEDAIQCFQRAVELAPQSVELYVNLALAFYKNRDFSDALSSYEAAARLDPKEVQAQFGIAWTLQAQGHLQEAMTAYERVLALEPSYLRALSNMIFIHHCFYPFNINRQNELVRRFGKTMGDRSTPKIRNNLPKLQLRTPLRVGIVSADLRRHVVSRFLYHVLEQLRLDSTLSTQLVLVAYANQSIHDDYSVKLNKLFNVWRRVDEWSDDEFAEQIQQDKIDILIDLSGHTGGQRLEVFARKPAPLQVTWLGYWGSTGLSNMDYVLADPVSVPVGEESLFLEKVWRLPHLRYCYSMPTDSPEVSPAPCMQSEALVFGCYQALIKINDDVLACWSRILANCPQARLRLQSGHFDREVLKNRFVERMTQCGLDIERVDLVGGMEMREYLSSYAQVDVLLDTFPYPGGATTGEALWMGVPTLTLATTGMLGRQGEALMVNAGLSDWVAYSEEDYVQKAITWGNADLSQRQALATLRMNMREQVQHSPVFDAKQFAGELVDALYGMWREKCHA